MQCTLPRDFQLETQSAGTGSVGRPPPPPWPARVSTCSAGKICRAVYVLDEVVAALAGGDSRAGVDAVIARLGHRSPIVKRKVWPAACSFCVRPGLATVWHTALHAWQPLYPMPAVLADTFSQVALHRPSSWLHTLGARARRISGACCRGRAARCETCSTFGATQTPSRVTRCGGASRRAPKMR